MQCDDDGIAAAEVEQCPSGCVDGQCAPARPCAENIVYSCDPGCPGPNTSPSCFELCPTPASGISPLLELSDVVDGLKYAIALPIVAANSEPCSCSKANGALQGFAFRVPSPPGGSKWRFTYPKTWELRSLPLAPEEMEGHYKDCVRPWPVYLGPSSGCITVTPDATPTPMLLSAKGPVTEPATVFVELLRDADATCEL
jgi:hypothetical protein